MEEEEALEVLGCASVLCLDSFTDFFESALDLLLFSCFEDLEPCEP